MNRNRFRYAPWLVVHNTIVHAPIGFLYLVVLLQSKVVGNQNLQNYNLDQHYKDLGRHHS